MKLTNDEQTFLREHLHANIKYSETYAEFYDHIVSALESKPQNMSFQEAVENIINDDFGGYYGINKIESHYCNTVRAEIRKSYFTYVKEYLQFPLAGVTVLLAVIFYGLAIQPWFSYLLFIGVLFTLRCTTALLKSIRHLRVGYVLVNTKKSINDSVFARLDYIPAMIGLLFLPYLILAHGPNPAVWFNQANPFAITFILLILSLHMLSFHRVYKNEFKISLEK